MAKAAAKGFVALAKEYIARKDIFNVALAGGSTPKEMHNLLSKAELDWQKVNIFFSDERYLAPTADNSNFYLAYHSLLKKVNIPNENIFPIPTLGVLAKEAAENYQHTIEKHCGGLSLDAIFLGIGPDGHTASIFPKSSLLNSKEYVLAINNSPKPPSERISFTLNMLNKAKNVVFLVGGESKAEAVRKILVDDIALPANLVKPKDGSLFWLLDSESARKL